MRYRAKDYQRTGTAFILQNKCCGIFADPGLGKTAMVLTAIKALKTIGQIRRVLIVAPLLVCHNVWPIEIQKWEQFNSLNCSLLHGVKNLKQYMQQDKADIYLTNPEGLKRLAEQDFFTNQFDMLVIDESSKFKNPSGKRFKLLKKYLPLFKRRVILTGTPAPNSLMDLFSQIYILDLGNVFSPYITHYRRRYFRNIGFKYPDWKLKEGSAQSIERKIAPLVLRFAAKDYLDLPELVYNYVSIQLPKTIQRQYDTLEQKLFVDLDESRLFVASKSASYRMCHQFANGSLYDPENLATPYLKRVLTVHDQKIEALQNLIAELQGKPLLIAYLYKHDLQKIQTVFPDIDHISGAVDVKCKNELIERWNAGNLPLLCCQISTISHGLNLQAGGNDLCFFSLTDNLEHYEQLIRRLYRQGTTKEVRVHHLIAQNTVDEAISKRLQSKSACQQSLLDALQQYRIEKELWEKCD